MESHTKTVWVLTDGRAGHRTQALGVAGKLPYAYTEKALRFTTLGALPNQLLPRSRFRLDRHSRSLLSAGPLPDIVIGAGRKTAPVLRYLKKRKPSCFTVYLMTPPSHASAFDMVVPPVHDLPANGKIPAHFFPTLGAVNSIEPKTLSRAASEWRGTLTALPGPRVALLVGGDSKSARFTKRDYHELGLLASELAMNGAKHSDAAGSLMVTTSPRSSKAQSDYLRLALTVDSYWHDWKDSAGKGNPYTAYLALADSIIVTADSISMASEACSLGKPVYIFMPREGRLNPKIIRFHETLFENHYARPLTAGAEIGWKPHSPLDEASRVANEIIRRVRM